MPLTRFRVSLDNNILKAPDGCVIDNNFPDCSQVIRRLVEKKWEFKHIVIGAIE